MFRAITILHLFTAIFVGVVSADAEIPTTQSVTTRPKTGDFEITFMQRSPDSAYPKLLARLNCTPEQAGPDYDLSKQPFVVHVPESYDGTAPIGAVVYIVPDGVVGSYSPVYPIFDKHNLIFIGVKKDHLSMGTNTGLCLDAVYNLKQSYTIDPARTYLLGGGTTLEMTGLSLGDLFTGCVYIWYIGYFKEIDINRYIIPPLFHAKPPALLDDAKRRVQVLAFADDPSQDLLRKTIVAGMTQEGFDHVINTQVSHHGIMQPDWLDQMLGLMESVPAAKPKPIAASQPAVSEAQQLLNKAQLYIDNGRPDLARDKLTTLIQTYPDDPAAEKAKKLLAQIANQ